MQVEARPEALDLDPTRTAIVVVDMQNDFGSAGGMFDAAGVPIGGIRSIIPAIARVLEAARAAAMPVVFLKMEYRRDLSDAGAPGAPNRLKHAPLRLGDGDFLVANTWSTAIVDGLTVESGDILVAKTRYSGFFQTDLDARLRERGVDTIVLVGATTSVCVESTLRDAFYRDYRCLLLSDCTAEPIGADTTRTNHEATLAVVELLFGWVTDSVALCRSLAPEPAQS